MTSHHLRNSAGALLTFSGLVVPVASWQVVQITVFTLRWFIQPNCFLASALAQGSLFVMRGPTLLITSYSPYLLSLSLFAIS